MKTFKVFYKEVVTHTFYVDAETEDDAVAEFERMANNGELDFSDGYVDEGEVADIKEM